MHWAINTLTWRNTQTLDDVLFMNRNFYIKLIAKSRYRRWSYRMRWYFILNKKKKRNENIHTHTWIHEKGTIFVILINRQNTLFYFYCRLDSGSITNVSNDYACDVVYGRYTTDFAGSLNKSTNKESEQSKIVLAIQKKLTVFTLEIIK